MPLFLGFLANPLTFFLALFLSQRQSAALPLEVIHQPNRSFRTVLSFIDEDDELEEITGIVGMVPGIMFEVCDIAVILIWIYQYKYVNPITSAKHD